MAHSRLGIRPFVPEDLNEVRFTIAKSIMEPLTTANKKSVYLKVPFTFEILTAVLPRLLPSAHGCSMGRVVVCVRRVFGLVAELPILRRYPLTACPASRLCGNGLPDHVVLRLVSRRQIRDSPMSKYQARVNRPYFERTVEKTMAAPDLLNIERTYCKPPSSFDILEYEGKAIGILAIDATPKPDKPGRAYIRHYYIADPYRESGVQNDLLAHAIPRLFASPDIDSVEAPYSMLHPYVKKALLERGFKIASSRKNGHYISWEVGTALLTKEKWEKLLQQPKPRPTPVFPGR
jgi:hypothetical protein